MIGPYFTSDGVTIFHGDCLDVLRQLPDACVHTTLSSPPYWALRDYGVAGQIGLERCPDCLGWAIGQPCGECYVCRLVAVFREVRRVLRKDGTLWLNLGHTYAGYWGKKYAHKPFGKDRTPDASTPPNKPSLNFAHSVLKPKDLIGVPWRVALALQADGWYLRSDVIWSKLNGSPESVYDRPSVLSVWGYSAQTVGQTLYTMQRLSGARNGQGRLFDSQPSSSSHFLRYFALKPASSKPKNKATRETSSSVNKGPTTLQPCEFLRICRRRLGQAAFQGVLPVAPNMANGVVHQHRDRVLGVKVQHTLVENPQPLPGFVDVLLIERLHGRHSLNADVCCPSNSRKPRQHLVLPTVL